MHVIGEMNDSEVQSTFFEIDKYQQGLPAKLTNAQANLAFLIGPVSESPMEFDSEGNAIPKKYGWVEFNKAEV